jgi:hypothetical protein
MSKFSLFGKKENADNKAFEKEQEINFMGGISYRVNPLDSLKLIAGSSIFGEPSYYRNSHDAKKYIDTLFPWRIEMDLKDDATTTDIFIETIDQALDYSFEEVLLLAKSLRTNYLMRLNPSLILVRAVMHPKRVEFSKQQPQFLRKIGSEIILRPDDITNQFELYMFLYGSKNKLPSVLKRIWKDKLSTFSRYQLNKYKSKSIIDIVRISHANSDNINELMQLGKIAVEDSEKTWENLRSENNEWKVIFEKTYIPHMALLRNLKNIFQEESKVDKKLTEKVLKQLLEGVEGGKQFPFRYYSAYNEINKSEINHKVLILDALENCLDKAVSNFPKLKGKTICLCDNSGSGWGTLPSAYGSVTCAIIANLSSIITAIQSDEGYVGVFGDKLDIKQVSHRNGILSQLEETNARGKQQGQSTENGIWLFFSESIKKKVWYDTIFIYSDMQAGHGGLYGTNANEYKDYVTKGNYIDVLKLVQDYRKKVNPKVNVFSVQVAGYRNSVIPENLYRTSILTGWTGNEVNYANYISNLWEELENKK